MPDLAMRFSRLQRLSLAPCSAAAQNARAWLPNAVSGLPLLVQLALPASWLLLPDVGSAGGWVVVGHGARLCSLVLGVCVLGCSQFPHKAWQHNVLLVSIGKRGTRTELSLSDSGPGASLAWLVNVTLLVSTVPSGLPQVAIARTPSPHHQTRACSCWSQMLPGVA